MSKKFLTFLSTILALAMLTSASACHLDEDVTSSSLDNSRETISEESSVSNDTEGEAEKVLLVSVDGLRPDALMQTQFGQTWTSRASYCLTAQTIYPSVTLPAHMSMFYGVEANVHGVTNNTYVRGDELGHGITETLVAAGKSCAMFYDWKTLGNITTLVREIQMTYIAGTPSMGKEAYEESATLLTNACIDHIENTPTDFTFLYFGLPDEMGHTYGWMSEKYYWAIHHVFENLERILQILPKEYVVIVTSDHGGGGGNGDKNHGSNQAVDMTIPFFIFGDNYEKGKELSNISILDVAPTVVDLLDVASESYWAGVSVALN